MRDLLQTKFDELFKRDGSAAENANITELMVIVLQLSCRTDLESCADCSTTRAKQQVASHVAQEFAHHWLSDLENAALYWLHNGLSDYVSGFAVDNVEPAWRFHELSMVRQALAVLVEDSKSSAYPVSLAYASKSSDTQANQKSALLFRMLHSLIGTQVHLFQ